MAKYRKWLCAADNHGDQADPETLAAFHEFARHWKPDHRIHLGDCFDLRWLRGKASEGEKRERVTADIDAGIDFIKRFKPDVFVTGNHDYRLFKAAECDDGKLADFAAYLICDIKDALGSATLLPWCKRRGVHSLGKLRFIHGYHSGVYAVRQAAMVWGNVCMGHIHASDQASFGHLDRVTAHSSGCIAAVDLDYNRGSPGTLRQSNGWLYGLSFANGDFIVWHAEKTAGTWVLPSEIRELASK